jgi:cell division protein FtsB
MHRFSGHDLLSRAAIPAACLLIAGYFSSHALFGSSGLLALEGIRQEKAVALARQQELVLRKQRVERNIALLDPRAVDPDFADELVRRQLGVMRPDEVMVPLQPGK